MGVGVSGGAGAFDKREKVDSARRGAHVQVNCRYPRLLKTKDLLALNGPEKVGRDSAVNKQESEVSARNYEDAGIEGPECKEYCVRCTVIAIKRNRTEGMRLTRIG